jgi:hypothetical protein
MIRSSSTISQIIVSDSAESRRRFSIRVARVTAELVSKNAEPMTKASKGLNPRMRAAKNPRNRFTFRSQDPVRFQLETGVKEEEYQSQMSDIDRDSISVDQLKTASSYQKSGNDIQWNGGKSHFTCHDYKNKQ